MLLALILFAVALGVLALTFPDAVEAMVRRLAVGISVCLTSAADWCRDLRVAIGRQALSLGNLGSEP